MANFKSNQRKSFKQLSSKSNLMPPPDFQSGLGKSMHNDSLVANYEGIDSPLGVKLGDSWKPQKESEVINDFIKKQSTVPINNL